MRYYKFAPISARCFPTIADLNNPWIFPPDVEVVVNVSQKIDKQIAREIENRGMRYYCFPICEEVNDIGWESIKAAVSLLLQYDAENKRMIVHCDFGQHRSRLVVEAFYFAKMGKHLIDEYKGCDNHLIYNCRSRYLPALKDVEQQLIKLNRRND